MPDSTTSMRTISPGDNGVAIGVLTGVGTTSATTSPEAVPQAGYTSRTIAVSPAFGMHGYTQRQTFWQTTITGLSGSPLGVSIELQGSIDNATWETLDTSTSTTGEQRYLDQDTTKDVRFYRVVSTNAASSGFNAVVIVTSL